MVRNFWSLRRDRIHGTWQHCFFVTSVVRSDMSVCRCIRDLALGMAAAGGDIGILSCSGSFAVSVYLADVRIGAERPAAGKGQRLLPVPAFLLRPGGAGDPADACQHAGTGTAAEGRQISVGVQPLIFG